MSRKGENIYRRKDGRWEARYIKGRTSRGNIRYGYCYGKTYSEARDKLWKEKTDFLNHRPAADKVKKQRFAVYCEEWLRIKKNQVKEATYVKYELILKKHILPEMGGYYPDGLTEMHIGRFTGRLLREAGLCPKTVRDILAVLHSVLIYTKKQTTFFFPVEVNYPKVFQREMRVLSCGEQKRLTEYLLGNMDECRFGVLLALGTGLRLGELCALKWGDISLSERTVSVSHTMQRLKNTDDPGTGKTRIVISRPKSDRSMRVIPLNDDTVNLCRQWKVSNSAAYVLTGEEEYYLEPRTMQYRMEQYTKECGLEDVHFHTLRHSFATRCVEAGFDIKSLSEILGHSSPRITLERYVHSSMELKRENMEKLDLGFCAK